MINGFANCWFLSLMMSNRIFPHFHHFHTHHFHTSSFPYISISIHQHFHTSAFPYISISIHFISIMIIHKQAKKKKNLNHNPQIKCGQIWSSNLIFGFDLQIWSSNLIFWFDLQIWSSNLIFKFDLQIWSSNLILWFDLRIWSTFLNCTTLYSVIKARYIWTMRLLSLDLFCICYCSTCVVK